MEHAEAITFDPHAEEDRTSTGIPHDKMGMWIFLCSEVMFFTGLIGSYIVLRYGSNWPDPKLTLNIWLTAGNTFILICSSVTMVKALEWIQRGDVGKMKLYMCLTRPSSASRCTSTATCCTRASTRTCRSSARRSTR